MGDNRTRSMLRNQAWERAKGELNSILCTYWEEKEDAKFHEMKKSIDDFIRHVEYYGYQE